MVQITVDLTGERSLLVKVAQLILQFAGYEPPKQEGLQGAVLQQDYSKEKVPAQEPEPTTVFGSASDATHGGWLSSHGSPELDADARKLEAMAGLGAAGPTLTDLPPPPPAAGIDVDARGLPWDARIHASTRAKTADGNWRQKRGVDLMVLEKVEDELRGVMGLPTPAAPPMPPVLAAPPAPPVPEVPQVPPPPSAGSVAPPAPPSTGTPSVPVSAGAAPTASPGNPTFPQLMQAITKAFTGGALNQQQIAVAVQKVGLPALPHLASRPDLVGAVATELGLAL